MKRLAGMLFSSWLATAVTGAGLEAATAAENVTAAIQMYEEFYIEKLQLLEPQQALQ
jgi:hypothetical protein